jgi:hypothetical protein
MQLNNVDLPAPFGPTNETISSSPTEKSKSLTAANPPKHLVTFVPSSNKSFSPLRDVFLVYSEYKNLDANFELSLD